VFGDATAICIDRAMHSPAQVAYYTVEVTVPPFLFTAVQIILLIF
jgi:hypothetical protein